MRRITLFVCMLVAPLLAGPPMMKITVEVKNDVGKPVENAEVVIHFVRGHNIAKLGKGIRREWDLRTNQEGSVSIPSIPQGQILIQVIAKNYQTFGQTFDVDEPEKTLQVRLNPPQPQYSAH